MPKVDDECYEAEQDGEGCGSYSGNDDWGFRGSMMRMEERTIGERTRREYKTHAIALHPPINSAISLDHSLDSPVPRYRPLLVRAAKTTGCAPSPRMSAVQGGSLISPDCQRKIFYPY